MKLSELKKTTKTVHFVDARDLERFLAEKIGSDGVEIIANNDSDHSVTVRPFDKDSPMYNWDMEDAVEFLRTSKIDCLEWTGFAIPLNYACTRGWIEPGEYVISVSW